MSSVQRVAVYVKEREVRLVREHLAAADGWLSDEAAAIVPLATGHSVAHAVKSLLTAESAHAVGVDLIDPAEWATRDAPQRICVIKIDGDDLVVEAQPFGQARFGPEAFDTWFPVWAATLVARLAPHSRRSGTVP